MNWEKFENLILKLKFPKKKTSIINLYIDKKYNKK